MTATAVAPRLGMRMGLDSVELLMNIEERFGFAFPEEEARRMTTVGDLHAYILQHATPRPDADEAWEWLKGMIVREFGVPERRIEPGARVVRDLGID